jgi:hypothetical protein
VLNTEYVRHRSGKSFEPDHRPTGQGDAVRNSIKPTYNHQDTGDRFAVEGRLSLTPLRDPFIHTIIRPRGWRVAWAVLRGRYSVSVHVSGDKAAIEDVLELDSDYLGTMRSTRRQEWDAQLESALRNV